MAEWRIVCENPDSAMDPCEVIYRLCKVDGHGKIVERDAVITNAEHGIWRKMKEAMDKEVLVQKVERTEKIRAVRGK